MRSQLSPFGEPSWTGPLVLLVVGLLVLAVVASPLILFRNHQRRRGSGFASRQDIDRSLGRRAVVATLAQTRPSLGARPTTNLPPGAIGISLGTAVPSGQALFASFRDCVGLIGPPGAGKTGSLSSLIIDAPGPTLVTSSRADIYQHTAGRRAPGERVEVFNPDGLGGIASTFRWSPVDGADDPDVAWRRAGYLIAGSAGSRGTEDRGFWEYSAAKLLRCYLMAAALDGADMRELATWAGNPHDYHPLDVLQRHPRTPPGWATEAEQLVTAPDRTRDSIFLTLSLALGFMANRRAAATVCPTAADRRFDPIDFLADSGTLYLLGEEREYSSVAPLLTLLTSELFEAARYQASRQPGGRLDPPLMLVLDEVATICPVPLERWSATAGGWGIPIVYAVQGPSQLRDRYGLNASQTIWNNTNAHLVMGGLAVSTDLEELSKLCGERDDTVISRTSSRGQTSRTTNVRRVPVMAPDQIRTLGEWQALVLHSNVRPVISRLTPVWERPATQTTR